MNATAKQPLEPAAARTAEVRALKRRLERETTRRRTAELALKASQEHYRQLLLQETRVQTQLRRLSHQVLRAQEEERKQISRELHDEISQILTGINVRLAALKIEATANTGRLKQRITSTQRLVEKSVAVVHQFARELRPAMLDDLGLIPTLIAFLKDMRKRTGLHIRYTATAADTIGQLDNLRQTVLYRIAQEALTNIARHAHASLVKVSMQAEADAICLEVVDDGKSFDVSAVLGARRQKRLGLIGMRERAEMVGGSFSIESVAGQGTAVRVRIPFGNTTKR